MFHSKCFKTYDSQRVMAFRTLYHIISLVLLQYFITFAQGQGPGIEERANFTITEEQPAGTYVGTLSTLSSYTYDFQDSDQTLFSLDSNTGVIRTATKIDRESLTQDTLNILVLATHTGTGSRYPIDVYITVLDINDHAPTFQRTVIYESIPENQLNTIQLPKATDADIGPNGNVTNYQIVSRDDDNKFEIVYDPDTYGQFVQLVLKEALDREEKDSYQLNISVQDTGSPVMYGYLLVNITVTDSNDHPPVFTVSQYTAVINESAPVGTTVIQVEASDRDIGQNGEVYFKFNDEQETQFEIDRRTGVVRTLKSPLYCHGICEGSGTESCQPNSCVLTLTAEDGGNSPLHGRAYLTITVEDENDHAPSMKITYYDSPSNNYTTVNENALDGSLVAIVTVSDDDSGKYGNLSSFSIIAGNELNHFRVLSQLQYKYNIIQVNGNNTLDKERKSVYNLTLNAVDQGSPPKISRAYLVIMINDINDNAPKFENHTVVVSLSERIPVGSFVANMMATDADSGINADLTYELYGNTENWFAIDQKTGLVTTRTKLHLINTPMYQVIMNVSVHDGGTPQFYDFASLTVSIHDENDMYPDFGRQSVNITLPEGISRGTEVVLATAQDDDSGNSGTLAYELSPEVLEKYPGVFNINSVTGQVTTALDLDREKLDHYILHVIAKDIGVNPLSSTLTVYLTVEDRNDNIPIFYPESYFANVVENQPMGASVIQVTAIDEDLGDNGKITYELATNYPDNQAFSIDMNSGLITTKISLSKNVKSLYDLSVTCRDTNIAHKALRNALVQVAVISEDEVAPVFQNLPYIFYITEDSSSMPAVTGREVGTVTAQIPNSGTQVQYTISDGDQHMVFQIDSSTGVITTRAALDREEKASYDLVIVAKGGAMFSQANAQIIVQDVNDNAPMFPSSTMEADIYENWPVGHDVFHAYAVDADSGPNALLSYNLQSSSDLFAIEPTTGTIYLTKPYSKNSGTSFVVVVTATDSGSTKLTATGQVKIRVLDVNDHTPVFPKQNYELTLNESTPVNDIFYALTATDTDEGDNSLVLYRITYGNDENKFGIFPDGKLYVAEELDRESRDLYKLTVKATDQGQPSRSSMVNVTIQILDSNDNRPLFLNTSYSFYVLENLPPGQKIGAISARDADFGRNAELAYFLDEYENFTIDVQTGELSTLKTFDRETLKNETGRAYYQFDAIVYDNGMQKLEDRATVTVHILDQNDNAPVFTKSVYTTNLQEDAAVFAYVIKVKAVDEDLDENAALTYTIIGGNDDDKFEMNPANGQISLKNSVDKEIQDSYTLIVKATDTGKSTMLTSTAKVMIYITDVNDNSPQFAQTVYDVLIPENEKIGEPLAQFSATDIDLGINGEIVYSLTGGDNDGTFTVDSLSGKLRLAKSLDYETKTLYQLTVVASDKGKSPQLYSEASLKVRIEDVNDNAPRFVNVSTIIDVPEDTTVYSYIATVTAVDTDSNSNGQITYSIASQDPPGSNFYIHPNDGRLRVESVLDRERTPFYYLTILATDMASPASNRKSSEKLITVRITDINDNFPSFISLDALTVPYPSTKGQIGQIRATDADASSNGVVIYQLVGGGSGAFDLESASGNLYLTEDLQSSPTTYTLKVRATDQGQGTPKSAEMDVMVILLPNPQNGPTFTQASYSATVTENVVDGTTVSQVSSNSGNVKFYIVGITSLSVSVGQPFVINEDTGMISTSGIVDREVVGDLVNLTVCAINSQATTPEASLVQVLITVEDQNDSPPKFTNTSVSVTVPENLPQGNEVVKVTATDGDKTGGPVTYRITDGNDGTFLINSNTGSITTTRALDRETQATDRLTIEASDGSKTSTATVKITITDVNDNAPVFSSTIYSFDVEENTEVNTIVGRVEAVDPDSDVNGKVTYSLVSSYGQNVFHLDAVTGVFTLISPVDFEQVDLYTLVVIAEDGGSSPLSSSTLVYMNIKDVNDNDPQFDPESYSADVNENVGIGTSVLTVTATDNDRGLNGKVRYSITDDEHLDVFGIGTENGTIYTKKEVDRETRDMYNLVVIATDQPEDEHERRSTSAMVTIVVKDLNDCYPEFITPPVVWVRENTPIGDLAYRVQAVDRDHGNNGVVTYTMNYFAFNINPASGEMFVNTRLDRELVANYNFSVTATDNGLQPLSTVQNLVVNIEDENDNVPVFYPASYSKTVDENVTIGTTLLRITATDQDVGMNGIVRYYIYSGDSNSDFSLDASAGILRVQKSLDYERQKHYNLIIQAEDGGLVPRYSVAPVNITVGDINDNKPVFLDSPYYALIRENVNDLPVYVTQISAHDNDSPPNSMVTYNLRTTEYNGIFSINATSGVITCNSSLDREKQAEYTLVVVAYDSGRERLTGTGTIHILVEDVNDNSPRFEQNTTYIGYVQENEAPGTYIIAVKATDLDDDNNAKITYKLVDDMDNKFTIDPNSGMIKTGRSLDREEMDTYDLTVIAEDRGIPVRSAVTNVTVYVDDLNDNDPRFEKQSYHQTLNNPTQTGQFVIGVTAVDRDTGSNGKVLYSLSGTDASKFVIDRSRGVVTAAQDLSGAGTTYTCVVQGMDQGQTPRSQSVSLTVNISSENSANNPRFDAVTTPISLDEDVSVDQYVTTVSASSRIGGTVKYYAAGGNVDHTFKVGETSGIVTVGKSLDYEMNKDYHLWIEARDNSNPLLSAYEKVVINVNDLNDNTPRFDQNIYTQNVPEDLPLGSNVIQVLATDADDNENGQITYTLAGGNVNGVQDTFSIDSSTGQIKTKTLLDRETQAVYDLVVEAADHGAEPLTGTTTVRITLDDINDNRPIFSRQFSIEIPEDTPVGSFIIQVTSTDADEDINAKATYSIEYTGGPEDKFAIDGASGNITLVSALDAEDLLQNGNTNFIEIRILADDGHYKTGGRVLVFVNDINDNAPIIQPPLTFNFMEMQPIGTPVGTIQATDADVKTPNNQIYFSLKLPSLNFNLNDQTGEITSKTEMVYVFDKSLGDIANQHELVVIATDHGTPPRSSESIITVNILDANDHPPKFEESYYFSAVPESSSDGESILVVSAKDDLDFGLNAEIEYDILSGNGSQLFFVNKNTGVLTVAQSLQGRRNQNYVLTIKAEDKGQPPLSATAMVTLSITDVNRYPPVFQATGFDATVSESAGIGQSITTVTATDNDVGSLNGEVTYLILDGNKEGLFTIDSTRGIVSVAKALDYDTVPIHHLNISARDKGLFYKEATAILTIQLTDVNDNAPVFLQPLYVGYIAENLPSGSSVIQVQATDADSGENAKIEYMISADSSDPSAPTLFTISQFGVITTKTVLDYETDTEHSLIVIARNPNNDNMKNSTRVIIHVTGVNEYYPQFVTKSYSFSTKESAPNGTVIGRVEATDQDHGKDGVVYYYLIGSSYLKGFNINHLNGDIYVAGRPDYESSPVVDLTVLAKNWESVKGDDIDTCTVRITVEDANDAPVFSKSLYTASIPENSGAGISVITVNATDNDNVPSDRQFLYTILHADENAFTINPTSGEVTTTGLATLDREKNPIYNVTVGAVDGGAIPATGSALLQVHLTDINDNGPYFVPSNLTGYVLENSPSGTSVLLLSANTSDPDLPPDQDFTYRSIPDNSNTYFNIDQNTGLVKTLISIDRELTPRFDIPVIVLDKGIPTQSSTLTFHVIVNDQNDSPPKARNMNIQLSLYKTPLTSGTFADVRPLDDDLVGDYTCIITDGDQNVFAINSACNLHLRGLPTSPLYSLQVSGSDGESSVVYGVDVNVLNIENVTLSNMVTLRMADIESSFFMKHKYDQFKDSSDKYLPEGQSLIVYNVEVIAGTADMLMYVGATQSNGDVVLHDFLKQSLISHKQNIENEVNLSIQEVGYSVCNRSFCNLGECLSEVTVRNEFSYAESDIKVLSSPTFELIPYCICPPEFTGKNCEIAVQPCGQDYCKNGGICQNGVCRCPTGWTGDYCETDVDECQISPCQNNGTCRNSLGSFTCNCLDGYSGTTCELGSDHCHSRPCQNSGVCKNQLDGYRCECPYIYWGNNCQYTSKGFEVSSYMEFESIDRFQFDCKLDLTFSTTSPNGLLMYNPSSELNSNQFMALEIVNSKVRFSFNLGDPQPTRLTVSRNVSTGDWFRVEVHRSKATAYLKVSHCSGSDGICETCSRTNQNCYQEGSQTSSVLDLNSHHMFIGGIKDIQTITDHRGQVETHDFVGCLRNFTINDVDHLTQTPITESGISDSCPRQGGPVLCSPSSCQNGGACVDEWTSFSCRCTSKYTGSTCSEELKPLAFGADTFVTYAQKESYRRDQLVSQSISRKRRSVPTSSSTFIRFRTTKTSGILLYAGKATTKGVLWIDRNRLLYTVIDQNSVEASVLLENVAVADGGWHNATVTVNDKSVTLQLDKETSTSTLQSAFLFSDVDVTSLYLGGYSSSISVSNTDIQGFGGCISEFELDGSVLPLTGNGSTSRFTVSATEGVSSGCSALCDKCAPNSECTLSGEEALCKAATTSDDPPLSIGVIVVIIFFGVLIIVIGIIFVVFKIRRQKKAQRTSKPDTSKHNGNGHINKNFTGSPGNQQNARYNDQEFDIQSHISTGLNGQGHQNGYLAPDLLNSEHRRRPGLPLEMDDGTVIMDNGDINMNQLNEDMPEHYDLENASSIAPSDIDVCLHYRGFRDGKTPSYDNRVTDYSHRHHKSSAGRPKKDNLAIMQERMTQESPGALKQKTSGRLLRNSPAVMLDTQHEHMSRNSAAHLGANSPINQLSRQSPYARASPLTHSNLRGTPVSEVHHSRTNSEHSLASHNSRSSTSSSVPRAVMPNGHVKHGRHKHDKYYDPNSVPVKGLTVEEVTKLNARPQVPSPVSMLEAVSSSSDGLAGRKRLNMNSNVLMEPPDTSSEDSANDSFTCSEFEYENDKGGRMDFDPSAVMFSKLAEVENENDDVLHQQNRPVHSDGLDSNGGSFASTVGSSEETREGNPVNGQLNLDYLFNWGPSFEKLVGVFKDIASLPDAAVTLDNSEKVVDREEYV